MIKMTCKLAVMTLCLLVIGGNAIKCQIGVGETTKEIECTGDWENVKAQIKTEIGTEWESFAGNLTSTFSSLSGKFGSILNGSLGSIDTNNLLQNGLNLLSGGRRKRADDTASTTTTTTTTTSTTTTVSVATAGGGDSTSSTGVSATGSTVGGGSTVSTSAAQSATAAQTAEAGYYCVKKTLWGKVYRTCLSQSYVGVAKMVCASETADGVETCTCNDKDNCNTGVAGQASMVLITMVGLFSLIWH